MNSLWIHTPKTPSLGESRPFLARVTLKFEIWKMTLRNNRVHLLYYFKLCALVNSNKSCRPEMSNSGQNLRYFVLCDLEIWQMALKAMVHPSYAPSSFVHRFIAIDEFKLKLQSRNAPFGSKSVFLCQVWPSNMTDDLKKIGHIVCAV